jgi:hypothetical protein
LIEDLDMRLVRIEDKKHECDQDWDTIRRSMLAKDALFEAMVLRIGELERRVDTVRHNISHWGQVHTY